MPFTSPVYTSRHLRFLTVVLLGLATTPSAKGQVIPRISSPDKANETTMSIEKQSFGEDLAGDPVTLFTCTNQNGSRIKLTDFGAIVVTVEVPDRDGHVQNVNLGFSTVSGYLDEHPFFGSTVGRFCNRIAKGQFELDGKKYSLAKNNGPNHLHGGVKGFNRYMWDAEEIKTADEVGVRFHRVSPNGEEGYPGNLDVTVTYTLNNNDELKMDFRAKTDAPTVVNLTNHNYWNLAGAGEADILDHELMIAADQYLAADDTLIPTGQLADVKNTPLDFTVPVAIGARIDQLTGDPRGYDHCFVLRPEAGQLRLAARVREPKSGRVMEVLTTQPGIQFYTGNFLDGGDSGGGHSKHAAFCLETQHYPDAPNHASFPSTTLRPGEELHEVTVHRFSAK